MDCAICGEFFLGAVQSTCPSNTATIANQLQGCCMINCMGYCAVYKLCGGTATAAPVTSCTQCLNQACFPALSQCVSDQPE
jgi:hypothetical protein